MPQFEHLSLTVKGHASAAVETFITSAQAA
jgi:hypothetical protein